MDLELRKNLRYQVFLLNVVMILLILQIRLRVIYLEFLIIYAYKTEVCPYKAGFIQKIFSTLNLNYQNARIVLRVLLFALTRLLLILILLQLKYLLLTSTVCLTIMIMAHL